MDQVSVERRDRVVRHVEIVRKVDALLSDEESRMHLGDCADLMTVGGNYWRLEGNVPAWLAQRQVRRSADEPVRIEIDHDTLVVNVEDRFGRNQCERLADSQDAA